MRNMSKGSEIRNRIMNYLDANGPAHASRIAAGIEHTVAAVRFQIRDLETRGAIRVDHRDEKHNAKMYAPTRRLHAAAAE